ncbi:MAG: GT4 family glycosyltransferase PelF [Nitrosopumilaceae archaeon]
MKTILMINWDNYPNIASGGVYEWAKSLIDGLTDYQFVVVNCLSNPNVSGKYKIPDHVIKVIELPLFGCQRYEEFYRHEDSTLLSKIMKTHKSFIENEFISAYKEFISELISDTCDSSRLESIIFKLHQMLVDHDSKKCLEDPLVFKTFIDYLQQDYLYKHVPLKDAEAFFQFIQRIIQILSIKLPHVDLIHSSNAWFPSMIGMCAKIENNCPMVVTEHGIAYKDLLLNQWRYMDNGASSILWKTLLGNISKTVCKSADVLAPVCYANSYFEQSLGLDKSRIKVIHNGVDTKRFKPIDESQQKENDEKTISEYHKSPLSLASTSQHRRPTVVYVGRIELLKDVGNLIEAIKFVKQRITDVLCLIYGTSNDLEYAKHCYQLVKDFQLEENIKFMGKTNQPEVAYNSADVVVLSSIREGFPFSVLEGMACGKPIVSTDCGGIREAMENYGLLVKPRHASELGWAISKLLKDSNLRTQMGVGAKDSSQMDFSMEHFLNNYRNLYVELVSR